MKIIFSDNGMSMLLNFRIEVIMHYLAKGAEVILIYPRMTHKENLIDRIPHNCTAILVDANPTGTNPLEDLKYTLDLLKIYKQEKPDLIFHYTIKPNIYGTLAACLSGVKARVSMVAGLGYVFNGSGVSKIIARSLYKLGLRLSSKVITLNQSDMNLLVNKGYVKSSQIVLFDGGEGVDLSRYPYRDSTYETIRFLMVARVLYDKGYEEFVQAARIVKKQYPHVHFELLGPIDDKSPMRVPREVIMADVDNGSIEYLGVTNNVPEVVGRNGVVMVLISSYNEGMNRSIMEALSIGCPIITSRRPGCQEMVQEGINGYTVSPGNPEELAAAIIKFIESPASKKIDMGQNSHRIAKERFDVVSVLKKYDQILSELGFMI